ncbi:peroxisomal biogenesis factor 3-like [Centruroides sculpturatus]|uniref:peroxisomal biogenesis factor 3-like n=2 Tax=Centruroides sculpturatus TaxID=218467 RepID=UPI000C6DE206|nr:peroxisomal biogenesis factor 3-like [Centruroides sculpturatus]
MWKNICSFFRRHRRKFLVTGGVIGALFFIQRYVGFKLNEWETKQTRQLFDKMKRDHHFKGTIQTCDSTILSMVCKVRERVLSLFNSEALIEHLKTGPPNKVEIWDNLKILIFSEIIAELYCECLFTVVLRIQLCVIGGYMYNDLENEKNSLKVNKIIASPEIQQKYLSHVNYFLNAGIKELTIPIKNIVESAIGNISLKHTLLLKDFEIILDSIRNSVCSEQEFIPATIYYVLSMDVYNSPNLELLSSNDSIIAQMTNETKDVLESADFSRVMSHCLEQGFAKLMDRLTECYIHLNCDGFKNPDSIAIPLAKVLPGIRQVMQKHKPNEQDSLTTSLLYFEELTNFSANIYETFSHSPIEIK